MSETRILYVTEYGLPKEGLSPTWESLDKQDGSAVSPQPTFDEIGGGFYKFDVDISDGDIWVGVVDAGSDISSRTERYIPVTLRPGETVAEATYSVYVSPVYDEDADAIEYLCFLQRDGQLVTDSDDVELNVYDANHTLQFTLTSSSQTNGVFVVTKSSPGLTVGEGYYVVAEIVRNTVTYTSGEVFLVLQ